MNKYNELILAWAIITTITTIIITIKSGLGKKILIKIGVIKEVYENKNYWTLYSWQTCLEGLNLDVDIAFLGDSITRGAGFNKYFHNVSICNLGLSGDTLRGMNDRIGMIKSVRPKKLFILGGINDLLQSASEEEIYNRYCTLLENINNEKGLNLQIYLQSLLPINFNKYKTDLKPQDIIKINNIIKDIAKKYNYTYIDLYSIYEVENKLPEDLTRDGIHLYDSAYDIWMEKIKEYIYE